jgi:hypothetical protein
VNRARYNAIASYAGAWLTEQIPRPRPVDEVEDLPVSSGVYVICDALERVCYVGSICRPGQIRGLARRLREHLQEPLKRMTWHTVWVVPLRDDTPVDVVRRVEGAVGSDLRPTRCHRLPKI